MMRQLFSHARRNGTAEHSPNKRDSSEIAQPGDAWYAATVGVESSPTTMRDWLVPGADEWFRTIYTRAGAGASEALVICSAISGEGKTTVSVGLAVTLAEDFPAQRVILVEADLERHVLQEDFGLAAGPGLLECLVMGEQLANACQPTALQNLDILPAGGPLAYGGRPLRSSRMATLIETLREAYDIIIIDTPALLTNSDAQLLTDLADGIIFVVRAGVTPTPLVNRALEQLEERKVRGVVLNAMQSSIPGWLRRLGGS